MKINKKEILRTYSKIYDYLYNNDLQHKLVNVLYPLYEENIKNNSEATKYFQNNILEDICLSDREYATAFCTMWTYNDFCKELSIKTNTTKIVESILKNSLVV